MWNVQISRFFYFRVIRISHTISRNQHCVLYTSNYLALCTNSSSRKVDQHGSRSTIKANQKATSSVGRCQICLFNLPPPKCATTYFALNDKERIGLFLAFKRTKIVTNLPFSNQFSTGKILFSQLEYFTAYVPKMSCFFFRR